MIQEVTDILAFVSATESDYFEPQTFREAWEHPDAIERKGWRAGIWKEFKDMLSKQIFFGSSLASLLRSPIQWVAAEFNSDEILTNKLRQVLDLQGWRAES